MLYFVLAAVLVALDQAVKFAIRSSLALGQQIVVIPHVLALNYVRNTGMAFASLSGKATLLGFVSLAVSIALCVIIAKKLVFHHPFGLTILTLILGGAVGNLIDRFMFGFVTDMFEFMFVSFYVFNVADSCVVIGGILMVLYTLFFYDKLESK